MNNEIEINGDIYVKKNSITSEAINFTGEESVASLSIGEKVIVRSRNEGINVGTVKMADETGVILTNARRIYYHKPLDVKLSWYEGVAMSGISHDSKISGTVSEKTIIEDYSMTKVTESAYKNMMEFTPNEQS